MRRSIRINDHAGRRKLAILLTATLMGLTAAGGGATAAQASMSECPVGEFCAWWHTSYTQLLYHSEGSDSTWHNDGNAADNATSVFNNGVPDSYPDVRVYRHINYGGASLCVHRGTAMPNVGYYPWYEGGVSGNWNDQISSHRWSPGC